MISNVHNEASIFNLTTMLGADRIPNERSDRRIGHYRQARRDPCRIGCDVSISLLNAPDYDTGSAELTNLSPHGALLMNLRLKRAALPLAAFKMTLRLRGANYEGIRIEATPIRLLETGFGLGVRFDDLAVELG